MFCFRLIKLILFGLSTFISMSAVLYINAAQAPLGHPDQFFDKIYAVHATRILPNCDYLRAGLMSEGAVSKQNPLWPDVRKTLHFALGEVVRPVEDVVDWESCPYAVVTPLRSLLPQLLNVNCYDTFIFGDLKLCSDTYLMLPIEAAEQINSNASIVTYDPQQQTLRAAVDNFIASMSGWHIVMNSQNIEDELHDAYLDGVNINTAEFFAPLKDLCPCLAVGLRFEPLEGEHYRLSQIEWPILSFAMSLFSYRDGSNPPEVIESCDLEYRLQYLEENFTVWSGSLSGFQWCSETRQAYKELSATVKTWSFLMRVELLVRECYGKTLVSAPEVFLVECISLMDNQDNLYDFIDRNIELLSGCSYTRNFTYAA